MMKICKLGDIGPVCMCKRVLKEQTNSKSGIPFYKIKTFGGEADSYIPYDLYKEYKEKYKFPKKGDILLSAAGTIGRTVIYNGEDSYFQDSNIVWIDNDESVVLNEYLYYFYKTNPWRITHGSTILRLYNENIRNTKISFPENLDEQRQVINILKTIDNKINNNNQKINLINNYLRNIYNYWFLQYEFPNKDKFEMIYSNDLKIEIPVGWKVKKIKDCIEHLNTGLNPRNNFKLNSGGNIKYITVKNLTKEGMINFDNCDFIDKDALIKVRKRSQIKKGDILFSSIVPLGRCYIIMEEPLTWEINESVFSVRPNELINSYYLYLFFTSEYFIKLAENSSTGSIFNGIRTSTLEDIKILVPDKDTLNEFELIVKPLFEMRDYCFNENNKLNKMLQIFLPLIISGNIKME